MRPGKDLAYQNVIIKKKKKEKKLKKEEFVIST